MKKMISSAMNAIDRVARASSSVPSRLTGTAMSAPAVMATTAAKSVAMKKLRCPCATSKGMLEP